MFPLNGLRVLDLSRVVSGPFAARMFADLGADVVKVEPPEGDVTRNWGKEVGGLAGFYHQQNAGKRNICIDLKHPDAAEVVLGLAAVADVVIENFRPGVAARLGVGWEQLSQVQPDLVMLSISGFGQTGPESQRRAYAPVIHAEAGLIGRQATFDERSGSDPMFSFADSYSSLHGMVATLAALRLRDHLRHTAPGEPAGQHIDIAMLHAMVASDDYAHHTADAEPIVRLGGTVFETSIDGGTWPILLAGEARYLWRQLSTLAGVADPSPAGADLATKIASRDAAIRQWVGSFTDRTELCHELDRLDIAWAEVRSSHGVLDSPTVAERAVFAHVDDGVGGSRRVVDTPYRFSNASSGVMRRAPHQGEHHAEVFADWLGWLPDQVDELEASGVLVAPVVHDPS